MPENNGGGPLCALAEGTLTIPRKIPERLGTALLRDSFQRLELSKGQRFDAATYAYARDHHQENIHSVGIFKRPFLSFLLV